MAELTDSPGADPPGADPREADFPGAGAEPAAADTRGAGDSPGADVPGTGTVEGGAGRVFADQDLSGATFRVVSLRGARMTGVDLAGLKVTGAWLSDVDISGELENVRINGVDVVPLIEAELDRRHPQRPLMRPADAEGFREAWRILERLWELTIDRARGVDEELLHERVDGEWSFIETLRHLNFAVDAWVRRAVQGEVTPWDRWDLPHDEMPDAPGVPRDRAARPALREILRVRAGRVAGVRELFAGLTDQRLASVTVPVTGPGYPEPEAYPVMRCLGAVVAETWQHRLYAERDLDVLTGR